MSEPRKFRVWYIHQIPGRPWEQEVSSPLEGKAILEAIYSVALFLFDNNMIPDYANVGGFSMTDEDGEWIDYDPDDEDDWQDLLSAVAVAELSAGGAK